MGLVWHARAQQNPLADPARVATLRGTGLLGGQKSDAFDRLANLAARFVGAPIAMVTLLDDTHLHALSGVGPPDLATSGRAPVKDTFCQHVVASTEPLIVDDAREHDLTKGLAVVKSGKVLAYAGIPLKLPSGDVLGTLCVAGDTPRAWKPEEISVLEDLAQSVVTEIEMRADIEARRQAETDLQRRGRPPPSADGQQPSGDLRAGPRGPPALPQRGGRAPRHRRRRASAPTTSR